MPAISYASGPYYPLAIIKPCIPDDEDFRQIVSMTTAMITAAGITEVFDTGYCQPYQYPMAFSTMSNNGSGITAGATTTTTPTNTPNLGMDNSTSSMWQSNVPPVLNAAHCSLGYDSALGTTFSPVYYNLWLVGAASITDPYTGVVEYSDVMDTNYSWELAAFLPVQSFMNLNTTAGALSVASVSLSAVQGTGWIVNTTSTVGTGGGTSTTTTASYNIASVISPAQAVLSVTSATSFAQGDYIIVNDGTHTNHFIITATATGILTCTLLPVTGDSITGTMGTSATVIQCGLGAIIQPVVVSGSVTSYLVVNPGTKYHVGDVVTCQVASAGSGATATVGGVNAAGMIQYITPGTTGTLYAANPTCTGSGGTGSCSYAVFTNQAIGVAGAIQQVIPCVSLIGATYQSGGGGYAYATPPTLTIAQASGGSSPTGAGTPTAKLTMSTGGVSQLNRIDIPVPFWASVGATPAGPTHRAFRFRGMALPGAGTTLNIYELQFYNYAGTYVNNTPYRLAPTSIQSNVMTCWKLFQFQDTLQSTSPVFFKVQFGAGATWTYPAITVTVGPGTDGAGTMLGPATTTAMVLAGGAGSSSVQPAISIGNTNWLHLELFKNTSAEIVLHIERGQTVAGADDPTQGAVMAGVTGLNPTSNLAYLIVMPAVGASPTMETQWCAPLGTAPGSVNGSTMTLYPIFPHNLNLMYPLKYMGVADRTGSAVTNGAVVPFYNTYGTLISGFVGGWQATKVAANPALTNGVLVFKNTQ